MNLEVRPQRIYRGFLFNKNSMEIWKDIPNYEGYYQVSDLGRVKSLQRKRILKEFIMVTYVNNKGYLFVNLWKNGKPSKKYIHQLVAICFLNHNPCGYKIVVDHINHDKKDNKLINLQLLSHRNNVSKRINATSSKHVGVCWNKICKKWESTIYSNGKNIHLGLFVSELEASKAYQNKLNEIFENRII